MDDLEAFRYPLSKLEVGKVIGLPSERLNPGMVRSSEGPSRWTGWPELLGYRDAMPYWLA